MSRFRLRISRRLGRAREGAAVVEFAMIGLPFMLMLFAIAEIAFVFVLDSALENAVIETGRLVRTGQADAASMTEANFKARVCERMTIFATGCDAKIAVDVREVPQFTAPTLPDPMEGGAFSDESLDYDNGDPGSLMLVRAWYRHTLFTPFLSQGLARSGTDAWLMATTAFRNEPWD